MVILKLKFRQYPAIHTNYSLTLGCQPVLGMSLSQASVFAQSSLIFNWCHNKLAKPNKSCFIPRERGTFLLSNCIKHHAIWTASVAEWLRAWDTLTMFEATVCGRSWVQSLTGAIVGWVFHPTQVTGTVSSSEHAFPSKFWIYLEYCPRGEAVITGHLRLSSMR